MIATAMTAMFALTYADTYRPGDVRPSGTRVYVKFAVGAAMAVIMSGFMHDMCESRVVNMAIVAGSVVVFSLATWLVRSQTTVLDQAYMRAMTPHHRFAILTSSRAAIVDVRIRELAEEIIAAQEREIEEMDWLTDDISDNGKNDHAGRGRGAPGTRVHGRGLRRLIGGCGDDVAATRVDALGMVEQCSTLGQCSETRS